MTTLRCRQCGKIEGYSGRYFNNIIVHEDKHMALATSRDQICT